MRQPSGLQRHGRLIGDLLVVTILVAVTSWLSLTLTRSPSGIASVWVANALLAGWLLSRPTRSWPGYVAAGLFAYILARELAGDPFAYACVASIANLVEVLLVAGFIRHWVPDIGDPKKWLTLGRVATLSTLAACAVSGLIASAAASIVAGDRLLTFMVWYPAHVIGMVVVGTLTLVVHREGFGLLGRPGRRLDFAFNMLLIAIVVGAIFSQNTFPLLFMAFPPLLWAAYRHRFAGVVGGTAILTLISGIATALGHGPAMLSGSVGETGRTFLLQVFIGAACVLTFPVALIMADLSRLNARLRDREARYRMLADYSQDVVVRMRMDGERLYVSPSAKDVLGWEPDELLNSRWDLLHPDDVAEQKSAMANLLAEGIPTSAMYRFRHKDGRYLWVEAVMRLIPSMDRDGGMDIIYAGRDISKRVAAEEALEASRLELETLARVDSLTNLANRRQFDERLLLALERSRRQLLPIALIYLDIDHFKQINDSLGHATGDAVLKDFARRLVACVRAGDLVARLGGDEFAVLIEDAATAQVAEVIARKLLDTMNQDVVIDGVNVPVTSSIGIAFSASATNDKTLMSFADQALYAAKAAGRNTYRLAPLQ